MKLKCLILLILLITNISSYAQTVDTAWVRRYEGQGLDWDRAYAIAVDKSGCVYVTGGSVWGNPSDCTTIKYDSSGNEVWVKRYNGPGNGSDIAYGLAIDSSSNIYVTGRSWGYMTFSDFCTIKYDSAGNEVWVRRYNGSGDDWDEARAIVLDNNNKNVYVTGYSWGIEKNGDYATIKYDQAGNEVWVRRYNSPGNSDDWASAIIVDDSGSIYVTGYSWMGLDIDYATIKYDSSGKELWVKRYNGSGHSIDRAWAIAVDDSNNIYVTGDSYGNGTNRDYATIKYDSNGNELWVRRYNGTGNGEDGATAMVLDNSDNVYVTGFSTTIGGDFDYATIKYSPDGNEVWVINYKGTANENDYANSIAIDDFSNIYVTGESITDGTDFDYYTIKYDSSGKQVWVQKYDGPGMQDDRACAVAVDISASIYVTGYSSQNSEYPYNYDYTTIKYIQGQTFIEEDCNQAMVRSFDLYQNYPNPFNLETNIQYHLKEKAHINLCIYNIIGQKVRVLADEFQTTGMKSVTWDGKDNSGRTVSSGIYVCKLKTDKYVVSKKMLLLK